jgi:hypothetical protein
MPSFIHVPRESAMRLTSIIILAVIVLGGGYVAVFKWDEWVKPLFGEGKRALAGYKAAKTPQEAMEYFAKAIKDRDYETAAQYVDGTYKQDLERAHTKGARDVAKEIDGFKAWVANKGHSTEFIVTSLFWLDPFPTNFQFGKITKESANDAAGEFHSNPLTDFNPAALSGKEMKALDAKMFTCCLGHVCSNPAQHPFNLAGRNFAQVNLVQVGKGDEKSWKLKIDTDTAKGQDVTINYYLDRHKAYYNDLSSLNQRVNNNRYESKKELERELRKVLADAK